MTTPNKPIHAPLRAALRLRMAQHPGQGQLDGGWWPQSRDLSVELAELVDNFPAALGRIVRATLSPSDWDPAPRRIRVARGYVEVGSFPRDNIHLMLLKTADHTLMRVLVVPPGMSADQGEEALLAAATPGYPGTAASLLATVSEYPDVDPADLWSDDGGAWLAQPSNVSAARAGT